MKGSFWVSLKQDPLFMGPQFPTTKPTWKRPSVTFSTRGRPCTQEGGISRRLSRQRNLALKNSIRGERQLLTIELAARRRIWHLGFGDRREVWPGTLK